MDRFTWQVKAQQTLEVYRWVLGKRQEKPDFGMPLRDVNKMDSPRRAAPKLVASAEVFRA